MTPPRPPRAIARTALHIVATCVLIAAIILMMVPPWFNKSRYFSHLWVLPYAVVRLYLPLGLVWFLRSRLSAPGDVASGAVKISAWAGICIIAAGIMWMSDDGKLLLGFVSLGRRDIPWFCLLVASESARLAVMRGSVKPRVVAIVALALAIGSSMALGSDVRTVNHLKSLPMRAFGSIYALVAARPWIAMICLAGLWLWVGLADRRRAAPTSVPE